MKEPFNTIISDKLAQTTSCATNLYQTITDYHVIKEKYDPIAHLTVAEMDLDNLLKDPFFDNVNNIIGYLYGMILASLRMIDSIVKE